MTVLRVLLLFLIALPAQAKLKVFILAGQSNMEGAGQININSRAKTKAPLEFMVKNAPKNTGICRRKPAAGPRERMCL